jgi:hypothetical protein
LFTDNEDYHFALLIRVGQSKNDNLEFHAGRIMLSLFKSFRTVMPHIKIQPLHDKRGKAVDIEKEEDIIFEEEFYNNY